MNSLNALVAAWARHLSTFFEPHSPLILLLTLGASWIDAPVCSPFQDLFLPAMLCREWERFLFKGDDTGGKWSVDTFGDDNGRGGDEDFGAGNGWIDDDCPEDKAVEEDHVDDCCEEDDDADKARRREDDGNAGCVGFAGDDCSGDGWIDDNWPSGGCTEDSGTEARWAPLKTLALHCGCCAMKFGLRYCKPYCGWFLNKWYPPAGQYATMVPSSWNSRGCPSIVMGSLRGITLELD